MYRSFESLDVWKRACRLATGLYRELENCRDYGLKDQMTRAAVSIASNIAEGYERGSNKDFIRFMNIAKGLTAELRTKIYIANLIGVLSDQQKSQMAEETRGIGVMLQNLANARNNQVRENDDLPMVEVLNHLSAIHSLVRKP